MRYETKARMVLAGLFTFIAVHACSQFADAAEQEDTDVQKDGTVVLARNIPADQISKKRCQAGLFGAMMFVDEYKLGKGAGSLVVKRDGEWMKSCTSLGVPPKP